MDIIAEIGQAHDGSLGMAHSYIDSLSGTGVNAVKFQTHIADAESSVHEKFRINFSYEDETRRDYWKRMEFSEQQWIGLKKHCDDKGLEFISSPFSLKAVDLLEKIGVNRYKLGSGEINNLLLIEKIIKTKKPVIISSGMSSYSELDKSIKILKENKIKVSLMQCTTSYPTKAGQWGLKLIPELKRRYKIPVGFSDHSGDIFACLAATALGANLIEFHTVFDKKMFGPDSKSSLTIKEIHKLVKGVKQIDKDLKSSIDYKLDSSSFSALKNIFEKSLSVNKNLKKGHKILFSDLESKKPSNKGIPASLFQKVIGKKLKRDIKKWEFINYKDLD